MLGALTSLVGISRILGESALERNRRSPRGRHPLCTIADRVPAHRRRAHGLVQLALRPAHGGKFLLRIEDTDKARSTQAAIDAILEGCAGSASIGTGTNIISRNSGRGMRKSRMSCWRRARLSLLRHFGGAGSDARRAAGEQAAAAL
jgi:hypothetical protein